MTTFNESTAQPAARQTPVLLILMAWLFVSIPLGWGVSQTLIKSLDLFRGGRAPAAQTSAHASQPSQAR